MSKNQTTTILDSDRDGLSDEAEINFYKTNPYQADTDGDGVDDGLEIALGRNPRGVGLWQDLFIPNQNNNFRPRALHPQRIFFYSLSAVFIKILVIAIVLSFPIQAWLTPDLLAEQSQKIVDATNNLRLSLNIEPLSNSPVLQAAALDKTEDMLVNQYFAHVSPDNKGLKYWLSKVSYNYQVAGENLAIGFSDPIEVVNAWKASPSHYSNLIDADFKEIGVAMVSGNYQGYDTTLVAQYFGTIPSKVTQNIDSSDLITVLPDQNLATTTNNIQVLSDKEDKKDNQVPEVKKDLVLVEPNPVLPLQKAKEETKLLAPTLKSPLNNFITKSNTVNLLISAPGAEKVSIWSSDVLLKTQAIILNQDLNTDISLIDGQHNIIIEAFKGDLKTYSPVYKIEVDKQAPILDQQLSAISASEAGESGLILKVDAYLSPDTDLAKVQLANYNIELKKDSTDINHWSGHLIIEDGEKTEIFNPLLMASLTAVDKLGNTTITDIAWSNVPPLKPSIVKQYLFVKGSNSAAISPLFDLSSIYYKIILILAVVALFLNIFIEIKKQHPKTIASTMGFIALLILLILF